RLAICEPLTWYRHGNSDCVSKRIVEGNADGAYTERVLLPIVGNAVAARRLEVGQQRVETRQGFGCARRVRATDQCFNGGIGKLGQVGFSVRGAIKRKGIADRGYGAQALRTNDLVDEHEMILLDRRKVDRLVQFFGKLLQKGTRLRYEIATNGRRKTQDRGTQPHPAGAR